MTVAALRRGAAQGAPPEEEISRLLECIRCGELVRVYEIPVRYLDETDFVGGCCLKPVAHEPPEPPEPPEPE